MFIQILHFILCPSFSVILINVDHDVILFSFQDAVHALHALDGKLALGKKLAVKWAHSHIKVIQSNLL